MVTSAVVPPLAPASRRGALNRGSRPIDARPMPVPALGSCSPRAAVYGLAVLDRYGRLAERSVLRALGWGPGRPLALTLLAGSVVAIPTAVPGSGSSVRIGNDEYLRLPVGVRRACHLAAGDRVLLVADRSAGRLLLHPPAALDALLDAHHTALLRGATP